jgi:hypothetical protein
VCATTSSWAATTSCAPDSWPAGCGCPSAAHVVDTQGVIAPLDYSTKGAAPTPEVYVFQANAASLGGLKQVQGLYEGKDAKDYIPPALKG